MTEVEIFDRKAAKAERKAAKRRAKADARQDAASELAAARSERKATNLRVFATRARLDATAAMNRGRVDHAPVLSEAQLLDQSRAQRVAAMASQAMGMSRLPDGQVVTAREAATIRAQAPRRSDAAASAPLDCEESATRRLRERSAAASRQPSTGASAHHDTAGDDDSEEAAARRLRARTANASRQPNTRGMSK